MNNQDLPFKWVGDLSIQDANILNNYIITCSHDHDYEGKNILEFGVGGSTQIILQSMHPIDRLQSVETENIWVEKTEDCLNKLKISLDVRTNHSYLLWNDFVAKTICDGFEPFDIIFNDGVLTHREWFGKNTWKFLKPGGIMLWHDTRHDNTVGWITELIREHSNEIETVHFNKKWLGKSSNMTVILKKEYEPYVNWNYAEDKPLWRYNNPEHGVNVPEEYWQ